MHEDKPVPWMEISAPTEIKDCKKCGLANQRARVIWGEGNPRAPVMILLDNPGAREDKEGKPYVCGTRLTLREAISLSGLTPDDIYLTFLLKCRPTRAYNRDESRAACLTYLNWQLAELKPRFLICMGNVVLQTVVKPDAELKTFRGKWLDLDGIPAIITYHPLAVRRRPNLFKYLVADLAQVAMRLHSK